jgi:hypothetical protein
MVNARVAKSAERRPVRLNESSVADDNNTPKKKDEIEGN